MVEALGIASAVLFVRRVRGGLALAALGRPPCGPPYQEDGTAGDSRAPRGCLRAGVHSRHHLSGLGFRRPALHRAALGCRL